MGPPASRAANPPVRNSAPPSVVIPVRGGPGSVGPSSGVLPSTEDDTFFDARRRPSVESDDNVVEVREKVCCVREQQKERARKSLK